MHQLAGKVQETEDEYKVREFQLRICEIAATCRGTYDIDPDHVPFVLGSSDDITILVECAITVYDNTPSSLADVSLEFKRLLERDRQLSHSLESSLRLRIQEHPEGLDRAITDIWTGYRPGTTWLPLEPPNDRWLVTTTAIEGGQQSQSVQVNLLEGKLLITEIRSAAALRNCETSNLFPDFWSGEYIFLCALQAMLMLSQKVLDVVPADLPDMDFATRSFISGYQVLFLFCIHSRL
jgi:hypothetical protein